MTPMLVAFLRFPDAADDDDEEDVVDDPDEQVEAALPFVAAAAAATLFSPAKDFIMRSGLSARQQLTQPAAKDIN